MKLKDAYSLEGKLCMTNLDSILKSSDITWSTKVCLVKAMVFFSGRVWMWDLDCEECWAPKNDAFELWCLRTPQELLRFPWTARRSNQSILKEISPGCSLEGLVLKLKLQYFGHLMRRVDLLEKTLMLGGIGCRRRRGRQRVRWLDGIINSMNMSSSGLRVLGSTGRPGVLWFMGSQSVRHDRPTELSCNIPMHFKEELNLFSSYKIFCCVLFTSVGFLACYPIALYKSSSLLA